MDTRVKKLVAAKTPGQRLRALQGIGFSNAILSHILGVTVKALDNPIQYWRYKNLDALHRIAAQVCQEFDVYTFWRWLYRDNPLLGQTPFEMLCQHEFERVAIVAKNYRRPE